jgi:hypothetical protein
MSESVPQLTAVERRVAAQLAWGIDYAGAAQWMAGYGLHMNQMTKEGAQILGLLQLSLTQLPVVRGGVSPPPGTFLII